MVKNKIKTNDAINYDGKLVEKQKQHQK